MKDYMKIDSVCRFARTLADSAGLNVAYHETANQFSTDGKTLHLPDPAIQNNHDIWMYGMYHEVQHNSKYREFMVKYSDPNWHAVNNIVLDYQHEAGLHGMYKGKDLAMIKGREAFLSETRTPSTDPANDFEALYGGLYTACEELRKEVWSGFNPEAPMLPTKTEAVRNKVVALFGARLKGTVTHNLVEHKQLIADIIKEFIKDSSCSTDKHKAESEAPLKVGDKAGLDTPESLKKLEAQFPAVSNHDGSLNKSKRSSKSSVITAKQVNPWGGLTRHLTNAPNISEQVRKLLMAKKQKTYEGGKKSGKFRAGGISRLVQRELDVFSKKQTTPDINTDVMLCIDISGSMCAHMDNVRATTAGFATVLEDMNTAYGILLFEGKLHQVKKLQEKLGKQRTLAAIETFESIGSTALNSALLEAAYQLAASHNEKAIIMVGDGADGDHAYNGEGDQLRTIDVIKNIQKHGIRVYSILIDCSYLASEWQKEGINAVNIQKSAELPQKMMDIIRNVYKI